MSIPKPELGLVALKAWTAALGVSMTTVWRWRKLGWIEVINIHGRPYVSRETIEAFINNAKAGKYAKECPPPPRPQYLDA